MFVKVLMRGLLAATVLASAAEIARPDVFHMPPGYTSLDMVPVGDAGNAADTRYPDPSNGATSFGALSYPYTIGKYEVTAGQYTAFLNAVAATDTYGLYNTAMADPNALWGCNIQRSGTTGNYTYSVASDWGNRPVNYVSFWDAARFVNWLSNGQGTGDTETGGYALNGYTGSDGRTITRNPQGRWFIPSEDEWYKAAYYKGGGTNAGYWTYATKSDTPPINILVSPDLGHNANFYDIYGTGNGTYTIGSPYWSTEVGAFGNSKSAYSTYDQGGNNWEWNETLVPMASGSSRGVRGGSWVESSNDLSASIRMGYYPTSEDRSFGFRVASNAPEPGSVALLLACAGTFLLYAWRRRRKQSA